MWRSLPRESTPQNSVNDSHVPLRLRGKKRELRITVQVLATFGALGVGLQTVTTLGQQPPDHEIADPMPASPQSCGQGADRFGRPAQRGHRIAPRCQVDQQIERCRQLPVVGLGPFAAPTRLPGPTRPRRCARVGFLATSPHRHTARAQLRCLRAEPESPLELVQMGAQHRVPPSHQFRYSRTVDDQKTETMLFHHKPLPANGRPSPAKSQDSPGQGQQQHTPTHQDGLGCGGGATAAGVC